MSAEQINNNQITLMHCPHQQPICSLLDISLKSFHTKKLCSRLPSRQIHFHTETVTLCGQRTLFILGLLESAYIVYSGL